MGNWINSFIHPKDRLRAYVVIMIVTTMIITAILIFAGIMWTLIQEKTRISENISEPAAVPTNAWNSLGSTAIAGNNASTNMLISFPMSVISVTSSN
jgi:hypothetical protein